MKDSTRHQYGIDFSRHIEPYLGERLLDKIEPEHVRRWHARLTSDLRSDLAPSGRDGSATVARAYRLLRAILQTTVDDELLLRNPCRLPGAGTPRSTERPVLAISEVGELAGVVPDHYRAYVVLAALSGLRAGELAALRLRDCVLGPAPSVRVARRFYSVAGRVTVDTPKSDAGARVVPLPQTVAQEVRKHLTRHRADAGPNDLVFVTAGGSGRTGHRNSGRATRSGPDRAERCARPRPSPHRTDGGRRARRHACHADADGGPLHLRRGAALPARHADTRPEGRRCDRRLAWRRPRGESS